MAHRLWAPLNSHQILLIWWSIGSKQHGHFLISSCSSWSIAWGSKPHGHFLILHCSSWSAGSKQHGNFLISSCSWPTACKPAISSAGQICHISFVTKSMWVTVVLSAGHSLHDQQDVSCTAVLFLTSIFIRPHPMQWSTVSGTAALFAGIFIRIICRMWVTTHKSSLQASLTISHDQGGECCK